MAIGIAAIIGMAFVCVTAMVAVAQMARQTAQRGAQRPAQRPPQNHTGNAEHELERLANGSQKRVSK